MPVDEQLIKLTQRALKNNENLDKQIKKLRAQAALDIVFQVNGKDITLLMHFSTLGNKPMVESLLAGENPASPCVVTVSGDCALSEAVDAALENTDYDISIIDTLLKSEPEKKLLLRKNKTGMIPLHYVLQEGLRSLAEKLLQFEAKAQLLTKSTEDEDTAFVFAARSNNNSFIAWLATTYPYILNERSSDGFTAMHAAARFSYYRLVWFLLKKGAQKQLLIPDDQGLLPIVQAGIMQDIPIMKEMLQHEAEAQITYIGSPGVSLMHTLCSTNAIDALNCIVTQAQQDGILLEQVLSAPTPTFMGGMRALSILTVQKSFHPDKLAVVKKLITLGGAKLLTLQDQKSGATPLLNAVTAEDADLVELLLSYEQDEQCLLKNTNGETPLLVAIKLDLPNIATLLIKRGPKSQLGIGFENYSLLCWALLFSKGSAIVEQILEYSTKEQLLGMPDSPCTPLGMAIAKGDMPVFHLLMASPYAQDFVGLTEAETGITALQTAVFENNYEATRALVLNGAKVNKYVEAGWTAVHYSCQGGSLEILTLLLDNGADITLKEHQGKTPLAVALLHQNTARAAKLMEHGADLKAEVIDNVRILNIVMQNAILSDDNTTLELLFRHGANPDLICRINDYNLPFYFMAVHFLRFESLKLFKENGADISKRFSNSHDFTMADILIGKYSRKPEMYAKLREIFPELPHVKEPIKVKPLNTQVPSSPTHTAQEGQKYAFKPRDYLLSLGFDKEQLAELEAERKQNKARLKTPTPSWLLTKAKKQEVPTTFFNGRITSAHPAISQIASPGTENIFCYLDIETLLAQGCEAHKLRNNRFKLGGQHVKKLDADKAEYAEYIRLFPGAEPIKVKYTHELKITKVDRVLLAKHEGLFLGLRYVVQGLHTSCATRSLKQSMKTVNNCLEVKWPEDIMQNAPAGQNNAPVARRNNN